MTEVVHILLQTGGHQNVWLECGHGLQVLLMGSQYIFSASHLFLRVVYFKSDHEKHIYPGWKKARISHFVASLEFRDLTLKAVSEHELKLWVIAIRTPSLCSGKTPRMNDLSASQPHLLHTGTNKNIKHLDGTTTRDLEVFRIDTLLRLNI